MIIILSLAVRFFFFFSSLRSSLKARFWIPTLLYNSHTHLHITYQHSHGTLHIHHTHSFSLSLAHTRKTFEHSDMGRFFVALKVQKNWVLFSCFYCLVL
ncbi:hypothetical protein B0T21DRAFT_370938 [Apiosordaria backusii]|uniref:Secreted protein n=1 Tax=Apiosordaria backusii TaxID=314023 RepID=A0AA40E5V3_9PEZI|nr:hypothetical protein B0T21DRAFT_370938 [Apiosordaria backusii]